MFYEVPVYLKLRQFCQKYDSLGEKWQVFVADPVASVERLASQVASVLCYFV